MEIARIRGAQADAGASQEEYLPLPMRFVKVPVANRAGETIGIAEANESLWVPTPDELALLNRGYGVVLRMCTPHDSGITPVSLYVDPVDSLPE